MGVKTIHLLLMVPIQLMVAILRNDWNGLGQNLVYLHGYFSIFASVALGLRNWQFLSKVNAVGLQLLLDVSWSPNFNV